MKDQINSIRRAVEMATPHYQADTERFKQALTALSELEAMAGSQEPVAWAVYWGLPPTRKNSVHFDKESAQAVANQIKSATEVRPLYAAPVAQQPSKATLEKLRAWETNGELIDRAWQVLQSQEQEIMRLEKMLAEERTQQPQAEVKTVYRLSPTDIYDFAGWLTTRRGVMEVGSSKEAAPMAEAVGEYLRAYPERFAPQQAEAAEAVNETNAVLASRYFDLLRVVEQYEKNGVTCQTYRHFVTEPCAECNSPGRCAKQAEAVPIAKINRYCRAGMCVDSDKEHEADCNRAPQGAKT